MVSRHLLLVLLGWTTTMNLNCDGRKCEIYRNPIICCGRIKRKHLSFGRYFHLNMAGSFNNRDKESDIWTANPFKPRAAGCGWRGTVPSYPQYPVITAAGPSLPPLPGDIDICQPVPPLLPLPQGTSIWTSMLLEICYFGLLFIENCYCDFPSEYNLIQRRPLINTAFTCLKWNIFRQVLPEVLNQCWINNQQTTLLPKLRNSSQPLPLHCSHHSQLETFNSPWDLLAI